jgi:hypothetical protein
MALPKVGDGYQVGDGNLDEGLVVGRAATKPIGFYGTTPIVQRTAAIATSDVSTASSADVTTALKAAVIDVMNTLALLGLLKAK